MKHWAAFPVTTPASALNRIKIIETEPQVEFQTETYEEAVNVAAAQFPGRRVAIVNLD